MKDFTETSRRRFLRTLLAGAAFSSVSPLLAGAGEVRGPLSPWGRLQFTCRGGDNDNWHIWPNGDLNLIDELRATSPTNVERRWNEAKISRLDTMTRFPFLFMHSEAPPELSDSDCANLREYLLRGGFLFAEDCVNGNFRSDGSKDAFFRRMAEVDFARILPEAKLERLPNDHPVFHCFHHFQNGLPHMQGVPHGMHGLILNGRVVALLSPSDIHCGWANGDVWFGHEKRVQAMQMGANIYIYAMTASTAGA